MLNSTLRPKFQWRVQTGVLATQRELRYRALRSKIPFLARLKYVHVTIAPRNERREIDRFLPANSLEYRSISCSSTNYQHGKNRFSVSFLVSIERYRSEAVPLSCKFISPRRPLGYIVNDNLSAARRQSLEFRLKNRVNAAGTLKSCSPALAHADLEV